MHHPIRLSLGLFVLFAALTPLLAQEGASGFPLPPKVLIINREFLKPGKTIAQHQKTESAFVNAMTAAKWPTHYFAMDSMSGNSRSLFFTGYESFEAWEKDNTATAHNATLTAALDRAYAADGELLNSYENSAFAFREDLSLRPNIDISHMRYFEIFQFVVHPGHEHDFETIAKMYAAAEEKASPDNHWAMFECVYGGEEGPIFLLINPMKSLAEIDRAWAGDTQVMAAMGDDGIKKVAELSSSTIASSRNNLFRFNPAISYPQDAWIKADPEFWKPKPAAAKKPASNPAQ